MSAHEYVRPIAAAAAVEPLRLLILTSHWPVSLAYACGSIRALGCKHLHALTYESPLV